MTNPQQSYIQNEIEQFNKDINVLLQDKLKKLIKEKMDQRKSQKKKKKIHKEKKQTEGKKNLLHGRV